MAPAPCPAADAPADPEALEQDIKQERARARQREQTLLELSREERRLHAELGASADRIQSLENALDRAEAELAAIQQEETQVQERHARLVREKKATMADLRRLLESLWPARVRNMAARGGGEAAWDTADREFTWLAALYEATGEKLEQVRGQQAAIQASLARQQELASEVRTRLAAIGVQKDDLLQDKMQFMSRLREVRREKTDLEKELQRILAAIRTLNFELEQSLIAKGAPFAKLKGRLPWPARGRVVSRYDPATEPPRRGLGLAVSEPRVTSVAWGKVMHDDVLRGFGRVIIVMHGEEYYTLYAYLAESSVKVGQEVERGAVLGTAGYYPEAQGPGVYFELRFHQKAINPQSWLTAEKP